MAFFEGFSLENGLFLFRVGKSHVVGVEKQGSLISLSLALRVEGPNAKNN